MGMKGISAWKKFNIGELGMYLEFFYELWKLGLAWFRKIKIPVTFFFGISVTSSTQK